MKKFLNFVAILLLAMGAVVLLYSRGDDIRPFSDNAVAFPITSTIDYVGLVIGSIICLIGIGLFVTVKRIDFSSSVKHNI